MGAQGAAPPSPIGDESGSAALRLWRSRVSHVETVQAATGRVLTLTIPVTPVAQPRKIKVRGVGGCHVGEIEVKAREPEEEGGLGLDGNR